MIKFIKSPVGQFGLSYFPNDVAELSETLEAELIEAEYAVKVEAEKPKKVEEVETPETPEPENAKKKVSKK